AELADQTQAPEIAEQAGRRLEQILIRSGDWEALLDRLNARLGRGSKQDDLALHEEIARLCRDRFGQREACAEHLEAAGRIAPERHAIWHNLAVIYAELDRPKDLLRVLENELNLDLDRERETMLRSRAARLAAKLPDRKEHCSKHYERLLELEPGDPEATEFLLDFYERENRPVEMAQLLRARLDATLAQNDGSESWNAGVISLRLRLAALQSEALDDSDAAIATLAPAIEEVGPVATVARPLADLYLRLDRREEFIALSQRAADQCDLPEERANWLLQVGDALQRDNEAPRAIEAYRGVLEASPQNLDAQAALRELYRTSGDVAPLAELLKLEVGLHSGASANPVRLELATLLAGPLAQPQQALDAFRQILEEDARHPQAFVHAIDLTRRLDRHAETLELLDLGLTNIGSANPIARAALLEQLGDLEAGPLDTPASALGRYREALALDPTRSRLRASICETLGKLGRWNELLDSLFLEAQRAQSTERCEIFERAIEIASREISQDAGLPWLERLHAERPDDPDILSRIADIHRQAGRPEALLRALEAQMPLRATAKEQHTLHCSMARILERDLSSLGRAAQTLEAARAIDADDPDVLADLDRLYEAMGRHAERAQIIEDRIACSATSESLLGSLHRDAANLWHHELSSPDAATRHLLHGIEQCSPESADLLSLIRQLQQTLRASGRLDGWARAAERELAQLTALRDPTNDERRYQLHSELADCCEHQLARPQLALNHLLALLDNWDGAEPLATAQTELAEAALIHHLRRERNHVELEQRLAARLDRIDGNSDEWLELAVLQGERLHRPSAARRAFRHVLEQEPECLEAIHGLRATAEIQQDWEGVAESLDRELEHGGPASTEETCALLLRLGEIAWRRLQTEDALERASAAYRGILTRKPEDVDSLHALQQIAEERGEYGEAISRYEQEVELLHENDSDRRQSIWLRVAEIARDKTDELDRAVHAFVSAAQCSDLPAARLREWADLYRATGDSERFAEVFGQWCDAPGSPASCADLLVLVDALQGLGRDDQALERAEMAIEADRTRATAWERAAELREKGGDSSAAADHLAEAAELADSATAATHLLHASQLVYEQSPTRSVEFLRRGADHDAGSQEIQARLAIGCERLDLWGEAEEAAGHALDMNADRDALEPRLLLKAALAGGRAAWREESLESATRLFSAARDLDPDEREALDSLGELLYLCGDVQQARGVLETRLAMSGENTKTGRQLAIVGEAFALEEEFAKALASFERAAEAEPNLDQAHEGIVSIHERNEKPLAAISALDDWIAVQEDAARKSAQLLRAAAIEQSIEETDSAIERLDEATAADPTNAGAWIMLADLLFRLDQPDGALEVATSGLAAIDDDTDRASVASLSFIRGSVLERAGDTEDAIAAFARTVENDSAHSDAALAQANLLRNNGEWQMAADALGDYLENHPEPTSPILARVHYKRGRLLAGPLEQVEEAIRCYELAIKLDPDFSKAIEPLANLLTHMPDRWPEAIRQHCALLAIDSARESSIRSLVKICETRGDDRSQRGGLAILRALGAASQEEFEAASDQLDFKVAEHLRLPDPHWERLRKMIRQSSHEIAQALSAETARARAAESSQSETGTGTLQPAQQAFWDSLYAAEAELSVPGFEVLSTAIIGQTIQQVAALALDASPPEIDSDIYHDIGDQLERSIGRWTRRKHRKNLEGTDSNDVGSIPWDEWRMALRGIAACTALDHDHGDLRRALITLSTDPEDAGCEEVSDTTNIADRVRSSESARALLNQVTRVWCSRIDN
ncbi:MAG: tetratricopeptide repeat protein, partial [Deltaproteobacteria bacterium]|nr:tetratricopeptide repeat protein [Deltaproteobacteria bacterium]